MPLSSLSRGCSYIQLGSKPAKQPVIGLILPVRTLHLRELKGLNWGVRAAPAS